MGILDVPEPRMAHARVGPGSLSAEPGPVAAHGGVGRAWRGPPIR
ncbi:hypothetical protein ACQ4WX_50590 [Streptomyces lasalocidi]